jgi:hypothetical protein
MPYVLCHRVAATRYAATSREGESKPLLVTLFALVPAASVRRCLGPSSSRLDTFPLFQRVHAPLARYL